MIALMYFTKDQDARKICLNLAMDTEHLELIPKGLYRDWHEVIYKLNQVHSGILLVVNPFVRPDKPTLKDILYLLQQQKPVALLLPETTKKRKIFQKLIHYLQQHDRHNLLSIHYYTEANPQKLIAKLIKHTENEQVAPDQNNEAQVLLVMLLILALLALSRK